MYKVYLLECEDGTIYTGITTDIERRLQEHKEGKGAHYTRVRGVAGLLHVEECGDRGSAQKREAEIKKWNREKKLEFVKESKKSLK